MDGERYRDKYWLRQLPSTMSKVIRRLFPKRVKRQPPLSPEGVAIHGDDEMDVPQQGTQSSDNDDEDHYKWAATAAASMLQHNNPENSFHWERTRGFQQVAHGIGGSALLCNMIRGVCPGNFTARSLHDQRRIYASKWVTSSANVITDADGYIGSDNIGSYGKTQSASIAQRESEETYTVIMHVTNPSHKEPTYCMLDPDSNPMTWASVSSLSYKLVVPSDRHYGIIRGELMGQAKSCFLKDRPVDLAYIAQMGAQANQEFPDIHFRKECFSCGWWTNVTSCRKCDVCDKKLINMQAQRTKRALNEKLKLEGSKPVKPRIPATLKSKLRSMVQADSRVLGNSVTGSSPLAATISSTVSPQVPSDLFPSLLFSPRIITTPHPSTPYSSLH